MNITYIPPDPLSHMFPWLFLVRYIETAEKDDECWNSQSHCDYNNDLERYSVFWNSTKPNNCGPSERWDEGEEPEGWEEGGGGRGG